MNSILFIYLTYSIVLIGISQSQFNETTEALIVQEVSQDPQYALLSDYQKLVVFMGVYDIVTTSLKRKEANLKDASIPSMRNNFKKNYKHLFIG